RWGPPLPRNIHLNFFLSSVNDLADIERMRDSQFRTPHHSSATADRSRVSSESSPLLDRLRQLNEIGVALSRETDINRLLDTILVTAKRITNSDGGTLYRLTDERTLKFEIMHTQSLGIAMGG